MVTNGLNYATHHFYKINKNQLEFINGNCFNQMYRQSSYLHSTIKISARLGVKVFFDKKLNDDYIDNYCLLNEQEVSEYLNWVKYITGISIKESKTLILDSIKSTDFKIYEVNIRNRYPYELRIIASLIRNIYEMPFNIMIKLAFLMKSHDEFKSLDFTERLCIAINSLHGHRDIHAMFYNVGVVPMNNRQLKSRYLEYRGRLVNVCGFFKDRATTPENRIEYNENDYEESGFWDCVEKNIISDEIKKVLIINYEQRND